jgi:glycosyltransferase involved in cell wall biosynthesis
VRICLIASSRFAVKEPFAGGLEAHTATLATELTRRGHDVSLFAAPGSTLAGGTTVLDVDRFEPSAAARADVGAMPAPWMREHHAYLSLMLRLAREDRGRFDVVHNNSLHHLPVAMATMTPVPVVTTLHTPPTAWLESAIAFAPPSARFVAVSRHTAAAWRHVVDASVVPNGIDPRVWAEGPGGAHAVWSGRLVPEKAPHLALRAARLAGLRIVLAGPIMDRHYFDTEIAPLLDDRAVYAGHLDQRALAELVGRSAVALVTPAWDEPFGLVAAEALACGTPVAAFARGGLTEILTPACGRLAPAGDVDALAEAGLDARALSRSAARRHAVTRYSVDAMVDAYEAIYDESAFEAAA